MYHEGSETYDVFILELDAVCTDTINHSQLGPYLSMAIPHSLPCHAQFESYTAIDQLPSEEDRSNPEKTAVGSRWRYQDGYGLRRPERVCYPNDPEAEAERRRHANMR
jgi:hypothetical protein